MNSSRGQVAIIAAYTGLLLLATVSVWEWSRARRAAQAAAENLKDCELLATQIDSLRGVPAQASLRRQSIEDLGQRIEQAAKLAKIPAAAIVRIDPQAPRRMGKSAHVEQPTRLEIRQVSLAQLARFLEELASGESGLEATSIRLTQPRTAVQDPRGGEQWGAEVVLTHLVFSPEYPARSSTRNTSEE